MDQAFPFNYWPPEDARYIGQNPLTVMDNYFAHYEMHRVAAPPENGVKAIALYVNAANVPTHVALRRTDGRWESKLGQDIRIIHPTVSDLDGPAYGSVTGYYRPKAEMTT